MADDMDQVRQVISATPDGVELRLKVVPKASRTRIVGVLGDRLKITVAAPPEQGQANIAVCQLLSQTLGVPPRQVRITAGAGSSQKTVQVVGLDADTAVERLHNTVQA